jgi:hypothetical protein
MIDTGGGVIYTLEDTSAELGYCIQCTVFISSMHIFKKYIKLRHFAKSFLTIKTVAV